MGKPDVKPQLGVAESDEGSALLAMFAMILPLLLLVGAASMAMSGRNSRLLEEIKQERAFLAAEAAIDESIYRARIGELKTGVPFNETLGNGMSFTVNPLHLQSDGIDNDGDGDVDEADEDVFQLAITGTYATALVKIGAFLGKTALSPKLESAVTLAEVVANNSMTVRVEPGSEISGWEEGNPAGGTGLPGLAVPPGTSADVISRFWDSGGTELRILGNGGGANPSIAESASKIDLAAIVNTVRNSADIVLTKGYDNADLGDASKDDFHVIYGEGKIAFKKGIRGAGIMVVKGELRFGGDFRFDGLVIVLGEIRVWEGANTLLNGGLIMGINPDHPDESSVRVADNAKITFSQAMLDRVASLVPGGQYVTFNGWQQLSKYAVKGF